MRNFVKSIYKGVLLFAAISVATVSNAQDYDLNNYKFRYQKYRGLSFDFSLSSGGRQEFNNSQNVKDSSEVYQNNGTNNNGFRIMPTYFLYENTDKLQRSTSISVEEDFVGTFSKQRVPGTLDSRKTGSNILNITYSTNNRFYTGNRFKYFYFYSRNGIDLNSSSYKGKSNIGVDSKSKGQSVGYSNNTNVSYGFGTGRLEYVTDAVKAMFIAENLNLIGKETLTNNQIEKVAQGITQIRNARYLDYRIGYKTQLTMLDSILQANGI